MDSNGKSCNTLPLRLLRPLHLSEEECKEDAASVLDFLQPRGAVGALVVVARCQLAIPRTHPRCQSVHGANGSCTSQLLRREGKKYLKNVFS